MDAKSTSVTFLGSNSYQKARGASSHQKKTGFFLFAGVVLYILLAVALGHVWNVQQSILRDLATHESPSSTRVQYPLAENRSNFSFPQENLDHALQTKVMMQVIQGMQMRNRGDDNATEHVRSKRNVITSAGTARSAHLHPRSDYGITDLARQVPIVWSPILPDTSSDANSPHNRNLFAIESSGRLKVMLGGVHYLYLQVTFNGRRQSSLTSEEQYIHCAFLVKVERHGTAEKILMQLSTTQVDGGGQREDESYPWDSEFTAGAFLLETDDRIKVVPDPHSTRCRVAFHQDKTFFGGFLIQ